MTTRRLLMPARGNIRPIDPDDPLPFYYRPIVGWFYRRRLEIGVDMLDATSYPRVLELGYGSGILLKTLARLTPDLHGVDIHDEIPRVDEMLRREGIRATLSRGDILALDFPDNSFDAVVCFSALEHIPDTDAALAEINRVLKPEGTAIIGFPAVNRFMDLLFRLIGFRDIDDHHVSDHRKILAGCRRVFRPERVRRFPWFLPPGAKLYYACKVSKRIGPSGRPATADVDLAAGGVAGGVHG